MTRSSPRPLLRALPLALLLAGCPADRPPDAPGSELAAPEDAIDAAPSDLREQARQYLAAWNGTDPTRAAAFYSEDATARFDDGEIHGRDDILAEWLALDVPAATDVRAEEERWERHGNEWTLRASYRFAGEDPQGRRQELSGSQEMVWTRDSGGTWRIREHVIGPSVPAPGTE